MVIKKYAFFVVFYGPRPAIIGIDKNRHLWSLKK